MTPVSHGGPAGLNAKGCGEWRTMIQNGAYLLGQIHGLKATNLQHCPHARHSDRYIIQSPYALVCRAPNLRGAHARL